ncbi:hypothetical protein [Pseudomonas sp. RIT-PI-AD]|uniref:hypothetical protein n=1 Tax=Pseudomonas sp. RIT-PI-AD TaxID=3035294 RepID=UPI0021DB3E8E|nr:hypothetical protein [Pseudomonas sp. RIT-PI-AD]
MGLIFGILMAAAVLAGAGYMGWQHFYPVSAEAPWRYRVLHSGITKASALVMDTQGDLLVAEEGREGSGRILRIAADGTRSEVVVGLDKPDGMAVYRGGIAFSQEGGKRPVGWLYQGGVQRLFEGTNVQGLLVVGPYLYALEDRKGEGRLLRYDPSSGQLSVLREGLHEAESLARCPDGRMLYTEKARGVIRVLADDGTDPVLVDGLREPSSLLCDARGLWISEDSTHLARLLLLDEQGRLNLVLSHLRAPQQLLARPDGTYLLAEGGRDRVLELSPAP